MSEPDKRSILLVVEGARQEQRLMRVVLEEFGLIKDYEVYSYGTNIYELYERMFMRGPSELEALSLMGVLKEKETDPAKRALLDKNFSDVLLVFDFEGELDNRFTFDRLAEMLEYFSESTDEGKLYINYPMVEACKHFSNLPDQEYLSRSVAVEKLGSYKQIVGVESRFQNYERDFRRPALDALVVMTVAKSLSLCGERLDCRDYAGSYEDVNHKTIFERQAERYRRQSMVDVLGTCLLFVCDYGVGLLDLERALELCGFS